jgi:hypothetical protein
MTHSYDAFIQHSISIQASHLLIFVAGRLVIFHILARITFDIVLINQKSICSMCAILIEGCVCHSARTGGATTGKGSIGSSEKQPQAAGFAFSWLVMQLGYWHGLLY